MDLSVGSCSVLLRVNYSGTFIEPLVIFHIPNLAFPDGNLKYYIWQMNKTRRFQTALVSKGLNPPLIVVYTELYI
jgi:hypothetical protein